MLSLFLVALASATLLPGGSEVWLARQWCAGQPAAALWLVATLGNTLGGLINVALGRYARHFENRRWFPAGPRALARAEAWYARAGAWSLLLSWVPLVGDALTVAAGVMRLSVWRAALLIGVAKGLRYAVVLWLAERWLSVMC
ncbi:MULTISPECIES: YqaA family protein [unclassified Modicisalibacter]|uniref:YqaA family protein n=1 Tax=unclassified Modicisalibacter TaxID=2679913 RepID=UPI001CCE45BD|nr:MULTISPECIES: YqaA family protein [unclassified Modicisalibacter]MBZ9558847.1 DedA family protein [Modicisalibacter sp. R2A 31.J]MBZ9575261.1 DedA family protein [Modicisalibacter sp. MOD 31.J]